MRCACLAVSYTPRGWRRNQFSMRTFVRQANAIVSASYRGEYCALRAEAATQSTPRQVRFRMPVHQRLLPSHLWISSGWPIIQEPGVRFKLSDLDRDCLFNVLDCFLPVTIAEMLMGLPESTTRMEESRRTW